MALPNIKTLAAVVLIAVVFIAGIALLTGTDRTEAAIDMTGTWNVNLRNNSGVKLDNCTDIITQTGSTLSATVYCSFFGSGSLTGLITKATGEFVGLSGTVGGFPVSFSGTTDGSSASGFWSSTFNSGTFTATKKSASLTFVVDDTSDVVDANLGNGTCATAGGDCTLRAAIQEANASASVNTIIVPAGTYTLTLAGNSEDSAVTGDLDITRDLFIQGAGPATTIVAQSTNDRVLDILDVLGAINVRMAGLTIADGAPPSGQDGGGIKNLANLILVDSIVKDNAAVGVGSGAGGGLWNSGVMTIISSTVSGNTVTEGGGAGIANSSGTLAVSNGAVHGNTVLSVAGAGGGIAHVGLGATLTLSNVTISGNTSGSSGGGLFINTTSNVTLSNVTVADNVAPSGGGGIFNDDTVVTLRNTIVAGNDGGGSDDDCGFGFGDIITSLGHNLDSDGTCGLAATGDISSTDPLLGSLRDNGGTTLTHRIHGASPATDAGNPALVGSGGGACQVVDQRDETRPIDGNLNTAAICDIGAFEAQGSPTSGGDRLLLSFDGSLTVTVSALALVNSLCPVKAVVDVPLSPVVTNPIGMKEERAFTIDFLSGWAFCPGPLSLGSSITSGGVIVEQMDTTSGLDFPADMTVTLCLKLETLEVTGLGDLQNCPDAQKSPIILNCELFSFTSFTCFIDISGGKPQFFNDDPTPMMVAEVDSGMIPLAEIPTPAKHPNPGDSDGDGCSDQQENGLDENFGGLRDYLNPWDFYDVGNAGGYASTTGAKDQVIDLFNDIVLTIQAFNNYNASADRGPSAGPNPWNMTAPDGVVDLFNDIVGVIQQFGHDCRL